MRSKHLESHRSQHSGWLRAAVLGANDGIVSTASLLAGVAAAQADASTLMLTGMAGLVAGAMSMAAGEYVSVQSQADTETADLAREQAELKADPQHELEELSAIYEARGLDPVLALQVAEQLTQHNALGAHARDELGITETMRARPMQAAISSAAAFAVGALLPVGVAAIASTEQRVMILIISSVLALGVLGASAAIIGGAKPWPAAIRVMVWGAGAMALTAWLGQWMGTAL